MSDPHSPRPQTEVVYPDAVRTALGLMRSAVLSGESWSVELAAAYEGAVAALPAADPAASAEADVAWEALKSDIIKSCPDDFPIAILAVAAHRPLIEAAIRSAGTPPPALDYGESRETLTTGELVDRMDLPDRVVVGANGAYWRDYGTHYSMAIVSTDNDPVEPVAIYVRDYMDPVLDRTAPEFDGTESPHALQAAPPEPVGGREVLERLRSLNMSMSDWLAHGDIDAADHDIVASFETIAAALQASPPTSVSDGVALDVDALGVAIDIVGELNGPLLSFDAPDVAREYIRQLTVRLGKAD